MNFSAPAVNCFTQPPQQNDIFCPLTSTDFVFSPGWNSTFITGQVVFAASSARALPYHESEAAAVKAASMRVLLTRICGILLGAVRRLVAGQARGPGEYPPRV